MSKRFDSIDIVRGLAIVLMALDHVRDFWAPTAFDPTDLSQTSPVWFYTRIITHFCAPTFVFLAGTSAYFQFDRHGDKSALSRFLLTRGLWLIVVELVIINISWQAAIPTQFLFVQVIWAIGVSMIILGLVIHLPLSAIFALGLVMVGGHNLLDGFSANDMGAWRPLWLFLHEQGGMPIVPQKFGLFVAYPVIPWPGVMLLGYVFGRFYVDNKGDPGFTLKLAIGCLAVFALLRVGGLYGDPTSFAPAQTLSATLMSFFNVTKYPPSLHFLLLTLGAMFLALSVTQNRQSWLSSQFQVVGKVPMFFYLLHVPIINLSSHIWTAVAYGQTTNMMFGSQNWPADYEPMLWRAYLVWAFLVIGMIYLSRHYWRFKLQRPHQWWWRYL